MNVYHGSHIKIKTIDLTQCKPNKDFGRGFYVTKFRKHAEIWARIIGEKHGTEGFVTEFKFEEDNFTKSICKIKHFETYNEEWLDFIVANRDKKIGFLHDYDIVIGPVADDKIQTTLRFYQEGKIDKSDFLKMLHHYEETHQICFCTFNSLQTIEKVDNSLVFEIATLTEKIITQLIKDFNINEENASNLFLNSDTYVKIADTSTQLYIKNWTEIYDLLIAELNLKK